MSDEITEFLRRAAQRKLAQQQQAPPPPPQPQVQQRRPRPSEVIEAEVVSSPERGETRRLVSKVSEKVAKDLDNRKFSQRADRLGDSVEQADERRADHLHQTFDHALGSIGRGTQSLTASESPEQVATVAKLADHPLLSALQNTASVKQAILLADMLRRPEENWE